MKKCDMTNYVPTKLLKKVKKLTDSFRKLQESVNDPDNKKILDDFLSNKTENNEFPQYVKIGVTSKTYGRRYNCLRLKKMESGWEYYRDAGDWSVQFKTEYGVLVTESGMKHLNGLELIEATREEYLEDNRGYVDHLLTEKEKDEPRYHFKE